jgi:protein-S-isoprenylcysteine O-methyltransferase Ste14
MHQARYFVAVLMLVSVPPAVGFWYLIHPFARFWRKLGAGWAYTIVSVPAVATGWGMWHYRAALTGSDLGTSLLTLVLAGVAAASGTVIGLRRRRYLTQRVLVGVPELSRTDKGRLLTEGIYARTRNPRYLELILFVLAYAGFANYAGIWILWLLTIPAVHAVVLLEERELRERFGQEYEDYCRRVPRYFPRPLWPTGRRSPAS